MEIDDKLISLLESGNKITNGIITLYIQDNKLVIEPIGDNPPKKVSISLSILRVWTDTGPWYEHPWTGDKNESCKCLK